MGSADRLLAMSAESVARQPLDSIVWKHFPKRQTPTEAGACRAEEPGRLLTLRGSPPCCPADYQHSYAEEQEADPPEQLSPKGVAPAPGGGQAGWSRVHFSRQPTYRGEHSAGQRNPCNHRLRVAGARFCSHHDADLRARLALWAARNRRQHQRVVRRIKCWLESAGNHSGNHGSILQIAPRPRLPNQLNQQGKSW